MTKTPTPFELAVKLLSGRDKSEAQLRAALERKAFNASEIDDAVSRVKALGYLNDARAAQVMAQAELQRGSSLDGAVARLVAKGFDTNVARGAVTETWAAARQSDEATARALLKKKKLTGVKAARFLAGRGFDEALIARLVDLPFDD